MKRKALHLFRKVRHAYLGFSGRERTIVGAAVAAGVLYSGMMIIDSAGDIFGATGPATVKFEQRVLDTQNQLLAYRQAKTKFRTVQAAFEQSQMSFDEVYSNLDNVVKTAVGSAAYDLTKAGNPTDVGLEFQRQTFRLTMASITMPQVVAFLHSVEHGESPLLLGRLELSATSQPGVLACNIEVSTLRRKQGTS